MALVTFGPQKYLDEQFGQILPAVMLGQLAALVIFVQVLRARRQRDETELLATPSASWFDGSPTPTDSETVDFEDHHPNRR